MDNYILNLVNKSNRNYLIMNIIITVIVLLIIKNYYFINLYNFFIGPFSINYSELVDIKVPYSQSTSETEYYYSKHPLLDSYYTLNNKYNFKIKGDDIEQTGIFYNLEAYGVFYGFKSEVQSESLCEVILMWIENKVLAVKVPVGNLDIEQSGLIIPIKANLESEIISNYEDVKDKLLPFVLDATGNFKNDIYFDILESSALLLFCIFNFYKVFIRIVKVEKHPLIAKISLYGSYEEIMDSINKEISDMDNFNNSKIVVTSNWIVKKGIIRSRIYRR